VRQGLANDLVTGQAAVGDELVVDHRDAAVDIDLGHDRGLVHCAFVLDERIHQDLDALAVLYAQAGSAAVDGQDRFLDLEGRIVVQRRLGGHQAGGDIVFKRAQAPETVQPAAQQDAHHEQAGRGQYQGHRRCFDDELPQLGRQSGHVERQAHDAVVLATDRDDPVDIVEPPDDQRREPVGRRRVLAVLRLQADGAATDLEELRAVEGRFDEHLAKRALDRVVIADDHTLFDRLDHRLDQHQRIVLRLFDMLQVLIAVEHAQAGHQQEQHRGCEHAEHATHQGARQEDALEQAQGSKYHGEECHRRLAGASA
jgi:hypothetical protein